MYFTYYISDTDKVSDITVVTLGTTFIRVAWTEPSGDTSDSRSYIVSISLQDTQIQTETYVGYII